MVTRNAGLSILAESTTYVIQNTRYGCLMMNNLHQDLQLHLLQGLVQ